MSQLWRDQLQVFFAPERVNLVRSSRGYKPQEIANISARCHREPDRQHWEPPLQQLATMLDNAEKTEMTITLSNHFIRYAALPPQDEITTPDELLAYANFRMQEIYAERVNDWILSVSAWNPSSGAICAAISHDLLTRLQELAVRHRVKLKGIVPYLVSAFDQWHKMFNDQRTYFVLIETGRLCIALLADNIWHSIRNQRILGKVEDELLAALDQEAIFFGHKEAVEKVRLFAPENPGISLPDNGGWKIVPIQSSEIPAPAHFPSVTTAESSEMNPCAV